MIDIDLTCLALTPRITTMMCQGVIGILVAKMSINQLAVLTCLHEGKDTGHISLEGQVHQVIHQAMMILKTWNTDRSLHFW